MLFNVEKCKCVHFGSNNSKFEYKIDKETVTSCPDDLGVTVHQPLQSSVHCARIVKKANHVLGIIRRTYDDKSKENAVQLYKSLVRPHLEYCVQAWRPYLQKDVDNIEKVQRRVRKMTYMILDNSHMKRDYEEQISCH